MLTTSCSISKVSVNSWFLILTLDPKFRFDCSKNVGFFSKYALRDARIDTLYFSATSGSF